MQNQISEAAAAMGRKGGKSFVKKYGKDRMKELGRLGGLRAKGKRPKMTNEIKPE